MKKIVGLLLILTVCFNTFCSYAFTFPEPDWGALLKEKEAMVNETDFELYVEGDISSAPYYGARLEPAAGAYIGTIPTDSERFAPVGAYLTYFEHMYQDDIYYPDNVMIREGDSAVVVGWTIHDMYSIDYTKMRTVFDNLSTYGKPMYIRFASEMNCNTLGDDPTLYVDAFRRVADMVHEYPNFAVVWSPNDLGALDRPFEYFYPGDEYVDWVGVSCYSLMYFIGNQNTTYKDSVYFMTGANAWATNKLKPVISFMEKNNIHKPVMLSECGVATNNAYGDSCEWWGTPRMRHLLWNTIMKFPQIKMLCYFNTHRADETERFDISGYEYAVNIFNEAIESGAYLQSIGDTPEFVFQPAGKCSVKRAENGIINLYTLAHIPGLQEVSVNYRLDGNWYGSANQIPYKCYLDISQLSDGTHTLSIDSGSLSKSYTFYKKGDAISFTSQEALSSLPSLPPQQVTPSKEITVVINGQLLNFPQQGPVLVNDRVLVPVREIFEALNATVDWIDETQTVYSTRGNMTVALDIGSDKMYINGLEVTLDVPAQLINDKTMVPARAISEAYNCHVEWDEVNQQVIITY